MIKGHGDDGYQYGEIRANFSSNVYHQLDLSELLRYLSQHLSAIHHYPEPDAGEIAHLLAKQYQLDATCISITNGATEAIYLIAQAFRGSRTTIVSPVFSEYGDACQIHQHQLQHVFALQDIPQHTELCWLCSPNNPTGEVYEPSALLTVFEAYPKTVFVLDQSYAAFASDAGLALSQLLHCNNVIVLHSMTKQFAIPGLRLGYFIAPQAIVERINQFRMPWSVNSLAIAAGRYLLTHQAQLAIDLPQLLQETQLLQQGLARYDSLEIIPSQTHYFLVKLLNGKTAAQLKHYLACQHHLLIRDAANFIGLDERYFRIATQTPAENALLVKAIGEWLQ